MQFPDLTNVGISLRGIFSLGLSGFVAVISFCSDVVGISSIGRFDLRGVVYVTSVRKNSHGEKFPRSESFQVGNFSSP